MGSVSNIPRARFDTDDDDEATTQQGPRSKIGVPELTSITPVMDPAARAAPPVAGAAAIPRRPRSSSLPVLSDDSSDSLISDQLSVFAEESDIADTLVDYDAPQVEALNKKQLERLPIVADEKRLVELVRGAPVNTTESERIPRLTVLAKEVQRKKSRVQTIGWVVLIVSVAFAAFAGGVAFHDARFVRVVTSFFQR
jgi:hypothetical protein